jgi:hypothetical protein
VVDNPQQRGIIKREEVVGLNNLESFKPAFDVFNVPRGDEKGGKGGNPIYVCVISLENYENNAKMI